MHSLTSNDWPCRYLWVPCSFLEPVGVQYLEVTADGVVTVIPIRVNANLKTLTVDELVGQKRDMHLGAFRYMLDEVRRDLATVAEREDADARFGRDVSSWLAFHSAKPANAGKNVKVFLERIQQQCQQVLRVPNHCRRPILRSPLPVRPVL